MNSGNQMLNKYGPLLGQLTESVKSRSWLILFGILMFYAVLLIPTIDRLGIGWDEATDLGIARTYLSWGGKLFGLSRDLSQTRLPMFVVALVFQLLGTSSLLIARFTTVFVGGLTLLGIYIYGKERFSHNTGLLAAALLAINPFFLSFARLAFTESDVYLACTLTWLLVSLSRLQQRPSMRYALWSGLFLGLSISSKATIFVIAPALLISFLPRSFYQNRAAVVDESPKQRFLSAQSVGVCAALALVFLFVCVFISKQLTPGNSSKMLHALNYGMLCLIWLSIAGWAFRFRNFATHPMAFFAYIMAFGLLTFVVFPPVHLTNSGIIGELVSRAQNEMTLSFAFIMELAGLHLFAIFLKSTPIIGLGLIIAFVSSLMRWRRPELRLPVMVAGNYMLGLVLLPLGQTFYAIPILPILSLLAADQLLRLYSKQRNLSLALISFGLVWWGIEMKQCYPDYHLNGYQWLNARPFLGRSSIGYRSIVYVPSDGVQQVMEWLNTNAQPGQVALVYVEPWHIVKSLGQGSVYRIVKGSKEMLDSKPEYVVTHIGASIWQGEGIDTPTIDIFRHPYDPEVLQREYEQVFVVRRAFDLEMASIWRRK